MMAHKMRLIAPVHAGRFPITSTSYNCNHMLGILPIMNADYGFKSRSILPHFQNESTLFFKIT